MDIKIGYREVGKMAKRGDSKEPDVRTKKFYMHTLHFKSFTDCTF